MNMFRDILYAKILLDKKARLEEEIRKINEEFFQNRCENDYISVRNSQNYGNYGFKERYPHRCLLCGELMKEKAKLSVDGHDYGMYSDIELHEIEQKALEILHENPDLSKKELYDNLHSFMYNRKEMQEQEWTRHIKPKRKIKTYYLQPANSKNK